MKVKKLEKPLVPVNDVYALGPPKVNDHSMDSIVGLTVLDSNFNMARRSGITTFEECPLRYLMQYQYRIRPRARASGRDQSSYAHITEALLLRGKSKDEVLSIIDKIMQDVAEDSRDPADPQLAKDASMGFAIGCYMHDQLVDFVKSRGLIIRNIEQLFPVTLKIKYDEDQIEIPFRFQVDFVIENPKTKALYIWDSKFIATSQDLYLTGLELSFQATSYVLAARNPQALGPNVKGIIFAACSKPTVSRKGLTRGEVQDMDDYLLEVYENLEGIGRHSAHADKRTVDPAVQVRSVIPTADDINVALLRMYRYQTRKRQGRNLKAYNPQDSCVKGYMRCDMLELCRQKDKGTWKEFISNGRLYTTKPDPLDSERLNGITLAPITTKFKVPLDPTIGLPTLVKKSARKILTNRWSRVTI